VLDPVEHITEVVFGLLMAMTFTGTISVATADQAAQERTMMIAALGCNLAWAGGRCHVSVIAGWMLANTLTPNLGRAGGAWRSQVAC
jgi:hypothetical protein